MELKDSLAASRETLTEDGFVRKKQITAKESV